LRRDEVPGRPAVVTERVEAAGRVLRAVRFTRFDVPEGLRLGPGLRRAMRSPAPGIDSIPVSGLLLSAYRIKR
jgi:hypothetical protein